MRAWGCEEGAQASCLAAGMGSMGAWLARGACGAELLAVCVLQQGWGCGRGEAAHPQTNLDEDGAVDMSYRRLLVDGGEDV